MAGIADRPAAGLLGELEQGAALAERDDVVDQLGFRLDLELVGMRERGVAAHRRARDPQHVRMRARLARARRRRGRRLGAARQPEPVHLADHRIAGDAAELCGDLTRRQAVGPQLLQRLDAFVGPGHASSSSAVAAAAKSGQNPTTGLGNDRLARRILPLPIYSRDLSAARNVVVVDRKATIWRESGARVRSLRVHMFRPCLRKASTLYLHAYVRLRRRFAARGRAACGSLSGIMLTARSRCNRIPYRAARRGGTFHFRLIVGMST